MESQTPARKTLFQRFRGFIWRWTCRFLLLCLGIIILAGLLFGWEYYLAMRPEEIQFGRNTTWIDEPMRDGGYPDYTAALDQRLSRNIESDKNCVTVLAQLIGPDFVSEDAAAVYYERLGLEPPTGQGPFFCSWHDYFGNSVKPGISDAKVELSVRDELMQAP